MLTPHLKYLSYVLRHKWHVFCACLQLGVPLHQAIIHDWQKFLPVEWFPYVETFYGAKPSPRDATGYFDPNKAGAAFDRAWLHHIHFGPHHWQHWVLREDEGGVKVLEMPERFVREMVADWIGAGKAQGKPFLGGWFTANEGKLILHDATRVMVQALVMRHKTD